MKIDWSKWSFKISNDWNESIIAFNSETGKSIHMGTLKNTKYLDDPARTIKEAVKEMIREAETQDQIRTWIDTQLPVEDNLDYIENEAEKRGLI
jgi:hypothetical protein